LQLAECFGLSAADGAISDPGASSALAAGGAVNFAT
jgi:hypothetical protein